jgi:mannan endo-1,4-beta-mannosidase
VKVSGQKFTLNGAPFALVGTNSYWVGLQGLSASDINLAFQDMAKSGATTVRTWGFNDVTSAIGSPYYQSWNGATPTINTGSLGLQNFDLVVAGAKAAGIKLIVALTNNWKDYGGMDVYTQQIAGSKVHGDFYTTPAIQTAFKNYVKTFVTRYKNDPTILSWELGTSDHPACVLCRTHRIRSQRAALQRLQHERSDHLDQGYFCLHQEHRLEPSRCHWRRGMVQQARQHLVPLPGQRGCRL